MHTERRCQNKHMKTKTDRCKYGQKQVWTCTLKDSVKTNTWKQKQTSVNRHTEIPRQNKHMKCTEKNILSLNQEKQSWIWHIVDSLAYEKHKFSATRMASLALVPISDALVAATVQDTAGSALVEKENKTDNDRFVRQRRNLNDLAVHWLEHLKCDLTWAIYLFLLRSIDVHRGRSGPGRLWSHWRTMWGNFSRRFFLWILRKL